mgnify:CR=1 FL=1|tara:strand:+ start:494 stop:2215 length:1722 start_codon:yes stop_codon:yes gene_type:complete
MAQNWFEEVWGSVFHRHSNEIQWRDNSTNKGVALPKVTSINDPLEPHKPFGQVTREKTERKVKEIWSQTDPTTKKGLTEIGKFIGQQIQGLDKQEYTVGPLKGLPTVGNLAVDTLKLLNDKHSQFSKTVGEAFDWDVGWTKFTTGAIFDAATAGATRPVGAARQVQQAQRLAGQIAMAADGPALYSGLPLPKKDGKGKFRRTKKTDQLHRLIDESKEAELAKQLGYENADAIEAGLKITPDKTGTIRFAKVNSDEGNALRLALLNRTKELLKKNNIPISKYRQVRGKLSKEFPTEIGGEGREFSGIGKALRADDPSKISFPLAKTRARGKDQRSKVTAPPAKGDLNDLADDIGMPRDQIHDFIQDSQRTFANVKKSAARESAFPGEFHAGHLTAAASDVVPAYALYPRSRKMITSNIKDPNIPLEADTPGRMRYPPTAGEAATIELGVDNIRGSNKLVHNINPDVARLAGVPDTWAELMKSWWKRKQGKGTKDFFSDWNQTERDALMDIPYDMPRKEALKRFKKIEAMRNQRGDMGYKEIQKDLKLQLDEDDHFLDWQSSLGILGRSNRALYT